MTKELNHTEAVEYIKAQPLKAGKLKISSNPFGDGEEQTLIFYVNEHGELSSCVEGQDDIDGVAYTNSSYWASFYKETFTPVETPCECQHKKPEVYKIGDTVEVLPNII